jgi:Zn-finger nucleic acid-binding protein
MGVQASTALKFLVACSGCKRQYDAGGLKPGSKFHCSCGQTVEVPRPKAHEADVVRCSSCSAPRLKGAKACAHCGSDYTLHERDLHTICPSCMTRISDRSKFCHNCGTAIVPQGAAGQPSDTSCPVCGEQHKLNSRALGKKAVSVLECPQCAGLWIGNETFRIIAERARSKASATDLAPGNKILRSVNDLPKQSGPMYRRCPECDRMMNRRNFGKGSGVIIDACKQHGIWFDAEELERVLAWIHRGGEARSFAKDEATREARKARIDRIKVEIGGWTSLSDSPSRRMTDRTPGSMVRGFLGALFDD